MDSPISRMGGKKLLRHEIIKRFPEEPPDKYVEVFGGAEDCYTAPFDLDDHLRLRELLHTLKGKFLLSYNDHPQVREWYQDFHIEAISRSNNLTGRYARERSTTKYAELINRPPSRAQPTRTDAKTPVENLDRCSLH